jgi:23S rRNA (cytidine1920-2'-O)/16S rRNA (cytidine1409-2'-O)-methyltransferase
MRRDSLESRDGLRSAGKQRRPRKDYSHSSPASSPSDREAHLASLRQFVARGPYRYSRNPMAKKTRLDDLLVARQCFADRKTASSWIMARKVRVAGQYITKPGTLVPVEAVTEVVGLDRQFVSRGGEKLKAALDRFGLDPSGRVVLDAGASTGGFTDCLLQLGAATVYAVDVGFGQLRGSIALDSRVRALERTNIADLDRARLDPPIELAVADLSYLSISKSLPILVSLFERPPLIAHLVKPLFEGLKQSGGVDRGALTEILTHLPTVAERCRLSLQALMASPILGNNGTVEFFALFSDKATSASATELAEVALGEAEDVVGDLVQGVNTAVEPS